MSLCFSRRDDELEKSEHFSSSSSSSSSSGVCARAKNKIKRVSLFKLWWMHEGASKITTHSLIGNAIFPVPAGPVGGVFDDDGARVVVRVDVVRRERARVWWW
jgi:hypothetical protein